MINRIPAVSFLPATAVLELTYACNHQCIFCSCPWEDSSSGFKQETELTTGKWISTISLLCSMGVSNIAFTGGEPLLRNDLHKIIRHAATCTVDCIKSTNGSLILEKAKPNLYLLSNGKALHPQLLEMCGENNVQLSLSLPGLETFKRHTGYDGAEKVLQIFSSAKTYGIKTVVNITVTKLNLYELERTISEALLAGAEQILLNRFLPGGRGLAFENELSLSAAEINEMLDKAENVLSVANRNGSLGTELPRCIYDPTKYKSLRISSHCSAGNRFFVIGPSGYFRVCNHSPVNLNHIDDVNNLKFNSYWQRFTQKQYLPANCNDCRQNIYCDGGCREAAHIIGADICSPDMLLTK